MTSQACIRGCMSRRSHRQSLRPHIPLFGISRAHSKLHHFASIKGTKLLSFDFHQCRAGASGGPPITPRGTQRGGWVGGWGGHAACCWAHCCGQRGDWLPGGTAGWGGGWGGGGGAPDRPMLCSRCSWSALLRCFSDLQATRAPNRSLYRLCPSVCRRCVVVAGAAAEGAVSG